MSPALSFVRGGRRKLTELENPNDPTSPTEIWASEYGALFLTCAGELVGGPVMPASILANALRVAQGETPGLVTSNEMALLIVALAHRGDQS
ncbi:hypothetical protein [Oceanicaulis sp. MMSF_3324]|uniref:hypothetical protein n=1 Tax=Oceanicaulis sp. MMSF_3324 TaxID=3046702 RepID=UPI00273FF49E|nr:hypothetical protein [Oceanicaulis sp. MMSF_3324]